MISSYKNDHENTIFTIHTANTTYQMKADWYGTLLHTYYGKRVPDGDLSYIIEYPSPAFSGHSHIARTSWNYSPDTYPQECSTFGCGDFRTTMIAVRNTDGSRGLELCYVDSEITEGKYSIKGLPAFYGDKDEAQTLRITLKDRVYDIYVHLYYGVIDKYDIITRYAVIENKSGAEIKLEKALSMNLDIQFGKFDTITFHGRHTSEREFCRETVEPGRRSVGSLRGASSHQFSPFAILCSHDATEEAGECYGFNFVYSGNFLWEVEYEQMRQTRVVMGINPENFCYILADGETFETPEVAMSFSNEGLGKLSRNYHKAIRNNLCRGKYKLARRPSLINNWEGTYMDFTGDKLVSMAEDASKLGIELFVMDDGWFGKRDTDTSGLGDWVVNEKKLGCTLYELAERIKATGMKFGIWFEPECISEDSDLFRAHPDWALTMPNRGPVRSRTQLVLDFAREDVREYILNSLIKVLESADISYVKWDFNRHICDVYSNAFPAEKQGEINHRYILGLYDMLEKLTSRFPDILFESCSGGGGRFDCGMLHYMPQVWCSDDTDPVERTKIQYGTSFGFPSCTVASHVSASPNHQTGRVTSLKTRGNLATSGMYGVELDINKMTDEEKVGISEQVARYKELADLVMSGDYYRLTSPYDVKEPFACWEFVREDGSEAWVVDIYLRTVANRYPAFVKIRGLIPDAQYRINGSNETYSGASLMYCGIKLLHRWGEYYSDSYHITLA